MSENSAVLRAQVDDLRVRIAAENEAKSRKDAEATEEYRATRLAAERDALRAQLAGMTGVEVSEVPLVDAAPAPEQPEGESPPLDNADAPVVEMGSPEQPATPTEEAASAAEQQEN